MTFFDVPLHIDLVRPINKFIPHALFKNIYLGMHGYVPLLRVKIFQAIAVSVLLYGFHPFDFNKTPGEKLDGIYTIMPRACLKKSWKKHPLKQQVTFFHTNWVRWAKHTVHSWRSKDEIISEVLLWTHQCYLIFKDLNSSTLYEHWMPSGWFFRNNGW